MTAACSLGTQEALFDFDEREFARSHADQDVATSQAPLVCSEQFSQHALHPVPVDGAREKPLGNDQTEPRNAERIGPEEQAESGTPQRLTTR